MAPELPEQVATLSIVNRDLCNRSLSLPVTQTELEALQAAADHAERTLPEYCRDILLASLRGSEAESAGVDIDFGKLERDFWDREQLESRLNLEIAGFAKAGDRLTYRDCLRLRDLQMNGPCADFFDLWKAGGIYAVKAAVESRKNRLVFSNSRKP
jgi:hypothetical protein